MNCSQQFGMSLQDLDGAVCGCCRLLKTPSANSHLTGGGLGASEFDMDVLLSIQMRKSQLESSRDLWQQIWSMNPFWRCWSAYLEQNWVLYCPPDFTFKNEQTIIKLEISKQLIPILRNLIVLFNSNTQIKRGQIHLIFAEVSGS